MTMPNIILRLEGLFVLLASAALFHHLGGHWGAFALLFLVPDISFIGFLAGPRTGSVIYNVVHSYATAIILGTVALVSGHPSWIVYLSILPAHIGFDRMLGYGLKYGGSFRETHLQRV